MNSEQRPIYPSAFQLTRLTSSELFASDCGTNLFSIDLRNGRIICGYKGQNTPHIPKTYEIHRFQASLER